MGYINEIRKKIGHDRLMFVGAGVFICRDGRVLLQRRRDDGKWGYHGGCVEIGESVDDAARRELYEETGLIAGKMELLGVFSGADRLHTYPNCDKVYIISAVYYCSDFTGEMLPETDETLELRWFEIDNLPDNIGATEVRHFAALVDYVKKL